MTDRLLAALPTAVVAVALIVAVLVAAGMVAAVVTLIGRWRTPHAGVPVHRLAGGRCGCWSCHVRTAGVTQPRRIPPDPIRPRSSL